MKVLMHWVVHVHQSSKRVEKQITRRQGKYDNESMFPFQPERQMKNENINGCDRWIRGITKASCSS